MKLKSFLAFGLFVLWSVSQAQDSFSKLEMQYEKHLSRNMDSAAIVLDQMATKYKGEDQELKYFQCKAEYFVLISQYDSGAFYLDKAEKILNRGSYDSQISQGTIKANLYYRQRKFIEAFEALNQLQSTIQKDDHLGRSRLFTLTGSIYFKKGVVDSALFFLDHSIDVLENEQGDEVIAAEAKALSIKGQVLMFLGQYDSSATLQFGALERFEKLDNYRGMAFCFAEIAGIKMYSGQLDESIHYYYKAIDYFKRVKKPWYVLYNNIGSIYVEQRKLDSAKMCFYEAIHGADQLRQIDLKANAAGGLGNVFSLTGQLDSSIYYYKMAREIFKQLNYSKGIAITEMTLANVSAKKKLNQQADAYLDSARVRLESPENVTLMPIFYEAEYEVRYTQGNYLAALQAFQLLSQYNDSIRSINMEERISQLEANYNLRIANQENDLLKAEVKAGKAESQKNMLLYGIGIGLLLVVLLFLVIINMSRKRKLKLREAEIRQRTMQQQILQGKLNEARRVILAKTEMLAKMDEQQATDIDYTEVSGKILEKITMTQEWAEFNIEFNALYKNFYDDLRQLAQSELTKNELRLCALIKLNLSNKEIADLLYITVDAVKKAKTRLTKKIELEENELLTSRIIAL